MVVECYHVEETAAWGCCGLAKVELCDLPGRGFLGMSSYGEEQHYHLPGAS